MLSAIRLSVAVIVVTIVAAVGVNLSLMETDEIDTLADPSRVWTGERVRVEVFNAGGVTGMARAATEELRAAGFDVVTFDNARTFDPERPSEVIDRVGRTDIAQAVAAAIGIDNVQSDPDPNLFVEVTVVVGRDWVGPDGPAPADPTLGDDAWWDPRSWF
ncbi:MAG: LytR C-terminal domain-containing protein [Longimicrobiales bacterium]|nr:LytR C-terminal domain-containing protein [Longimicrobiales bacterium]